VPGPCYVENWSRALDAMTVWKMLLAVVRGMDSH
jgi:hypothetical protein